ncbi:MAG: hypothetical protein RL518_1973, partial [Pseudomonadota bacterium]
MRTLTTVISCLVGLYSTLMLSLFLSIADQPLGRMGYLPINPTLCAVVLIAPFFVAALIRDLVKRSSTRVLPPLIANGGPYCAFFFIASCSLLYSILPGAYWDEGGKWIFLIFYGFSISMLALYIPQASWFPSFFPYCGLSALLLLGWSIYL